MAGCVQCKEEPGQAGALQVAGRLAVASGQNLRTVCHLPSAFSQSQEVQGGQEEFQMQMQHPSPCDPALKRLGANRRFVELSATGSDTARSIESFSKSSCGRWKCKREFPASKWGTFQVGPVCGAMEEPRFNNSNSSDTKSYHLCLFRYTAQRQLQSVDDRPLDLLSQSGFQ